MKTLPILSVIWLVVGCSSEPTKAPKRPIVIPRVNLLAIEYFSPKSLPEDPLPEEVLNAHSDAKCEIPHQFYSKRLPGVSLATVRTCLNSIESGTATYLYHFQEPPVLELDPDEPQPKCLAKALPKIPLPKQVIFLSEDNRKGSLTAEPVREQCFSGSFNTREKTVLDTTWLTKKLKVQITFPISRTLKSDQDVRLWLTVTTLNLLMKNQTEQNFIQSVVVPDSMCRACFRNDLHFEQKRGEAIAPVFYPSLERPMEDPALLKPGP